MRALLIGVLLIAGISMATIEPALAARVDKTGVCHRADNQRWVFVAVPTKQLDKEVGHFRHDGDVLTGISKDDCLALNAAALAPDTDVAGEIIVANSSPPTNGGNGAGKSGQCEGPPSDRPAVCPGT